MRKNQPWPDRLRKEVIRHNLQQFSNRRRIFRHSAGRVLMRSDPRRRGFWHVPPYRNDRFRDPRRPIAPRKAVWPAKHALMMFRALHDQFISNKQNATHGAR
jgi:hypothetical protein